MEDRKMLYAKTKLIMLLILTIFVFISSTTSIAKEKVLFEKHYDVKMGETLFAKMVSADIIISSWDKEEVSVVIEGSEKINDYYDFDFSYESGIVKVKSEKKSDWDIFSFSRGFKLIVSVPSKFKLDLKTSGGDIGIKMVDGTKEIITSGGDIEVENSKGDLGAITSGGDISIIKYVGRSVLKTSGGNIVVKELKGGLEAATSGGDIEIFSNEGEISAKTSGGDIVLNYDGENRGIELGTSGGDISILLNPVFTADVLLKTSGGSIKNNFNNSKMNELTKSKFVGKFNNGGSSLTAKTSGGSITVDEK